MNESQLILLGLFAAAAAAAAFLWRQLTSVQAQVATARDEAESARAETAKVRNEAKTKRAELDKVRDQLDRTKTKLEKARSTQEPKTARRRRGPEPKLAEPEIEVDPSTSAAQVVRVSSRELEASHRKAIESLEARLAETQGQLETFRKEADRQAEAQARAAAAFEAEIAEDDDGETQDTPEARIEALERDLKAVRGAATDAAKTHKRDLKKLEARLDAAQRRAANDHAAYQVIKGHLELAEDRLATLRRRYEGAKAPQAVAPAKPKGGKRKKRGKGGTKPDAAALAQETVELAEAVAADEAAPIQVAATEAEVLPAAEQEAVASSEADAPVEQDPPAAPELAPAPDTTVPTTIDEAPAEPTEDAAAASEDHPTEVPAAVEKT